MDNAGGRQVAWLPNYATYVFCVFCNFAFSNFCVGLVRFLRGRLAVFHVSGNLRKDARCLCVMFFGNTFPMGNRPAIRHDLPARDGRGAFQFLFLGCFLCRMEDRERRVSLVNCSFANLRHDGIEISGGNFCAFLFRDLRNLQAQVIGLSNFASFRDAKTRRRCFLCVLFFR